MSVFTFHSAIHCSHVLRCLDEQRQNDVLCDVTVMVGSSCFHAHSSVLASCSNYFRTRIKHTSHNLVINLPEEVTVEGFQPLLEFAYTAKLIFTKENILEIYKCANFLGFHNLDTACFEFLIPKFFNNSKTVQAVKRNFCCQNILSSNRLDQHRAKEQVAEATSQNSVNKQQSPKTQWLNFKSNKESSESCSSVPLGRDEQIKNLTVQVVSGQEQFCLQNCGPEMPLLSPAVTDSVCPVLTLPFINDGSTAEECIRDIFESGPVSNQNEVTVVSPSISSEPPVADDITDPHKKADENLASSTGTLLPIAESNSSPCEQCPLKTLASVEEVDVLGSNEAVTCGLSDPNSSDLAHANGYGDRSCVEREVAEHLAKGFWPEVCTSQAELLPLDTLDQSTLGKATDFHWLKQLDLSSSTFDCPFLRDLGTGEVPEPTGNSEPQEQTPAPQQQIPPCNQQTTVNQDQTAVPQDQIEVPQQKASLPEEQTAVPQDQTVVLQEQTVESNDLSKSEKSPSMSSLNSGEDSDLDTEGDSRSTKERAREVQLPFPVEEISSISRSAFQSLLRRQYLTQDQLEFVHEVRRRSKNRVAAQRCRKRKLDGIYKLQCEIGKLKGEKDKLILERSQLKVSMKEVLNSLSGLRPSVNDAASTEPDQPNVLAKYSSLDCSLSTHLTSLSSPSLACQVNNSQTSLSTDLFPEKSLSAGVVSTLTTSDFSVLKPAQTYLITAERLGTEPNDACTIMDVCLDLNCDQ